MKVAVITDGNSGITIQEANELGIKVVPMPFLIDGEEYFENVKEKGLSEKLCNYVWNVLVATSRGYGFRIN